MGTIVKRRIPMTLNDLEIAVQVLEEEEIKRGCCMPYDCMHHEMCDEDSGYCYQCQRMIELLAQVRHLTPADWEEARVEKERGERAAFAYRLETVRELEAIGDYAAAERMFGDEEEV